MNVPHTHTLTFAQLLTCYLQCAADPKLHGRRARHKVQRLEHVTQRPHDDHRDAHAERRFVVEIAQKLRQACVGRSNLFV